MSRRLLINLFLLLAIIVAGLLLVLPDNPDIKEDVILTDLDPLAVKTITILRADSDDIRFSKEGDTWMMQSPYALPANPVRIHTMLGLLQAHSYTQLDKNEVELHRLALDKPVVSIRFNDTQIDFGDSSPLGKQRYVRVADTVHLVNDSLYEQLQTPATFFLSNRLLPKAGKIAAIIFPDETLRWQDERWQLAPSRDISADDMARVVNAWQQAEAVSVREFEETEQHGNIRIEFQDGEPLEFAIVTPPPALVLARPDIGLQYHMSSYEAKQMFLPSEDENTSEQDSVSPPSPPSPLKGEGH